MIPGEYLLRSESIVINKGRSSIVISVVNSGDRPIQVGSHYHFYETNDFLLFDREKTKGMRLNISAGTAVRFEPGQERTIELVSIDGLKIIQGFQGKIQGELE
ncbi:urease subunit beta [Ferrovum sp. PN-J185]|uniref:urease subunit beta n=1 Tax=Ferrovum sp. PN-J185 TaxID=1356306 RepID=UPI00079B2419|nr:urease subunit beta [Ferrovum sp. PN-J185]KXW56935.1 urease subunit beta [Ferrovum sp. PN-J185]MCC6069192.1 urease subunit beta [Ferrovum sp. PN-J185]MDE1892345.1 urease subunit beta [Betaproteobacteria bacterium]